MPTGFTVAHISFILKVFPEVPSTVMYNLTPVVSLVLPPAAKQRRTCHHSCRNFSDARRAGARWGFCFFDFHPKPQHEDAFLIRTLLHWASTRTTITTLFAGCWDALKVTAVLISSTVPNESFNAMKGKCRCNFNLHMVPFFKPSTLYDAQGTFAGISLFVACLESR